MSPRFDLVLRNGTLVIPGVGTVAADVGICGSRIAAIGEKLSGAAQDVLDAGGKVVLPGLFDPHVHIGNELSFEQEAQSETRAAILGGVTTIGIMVRSLEDSYFLHLPAFRRAMDETSYVDSVFHLQIFTEQQIAEMPDYARQYGVRSFKFYMSGIPGIVKSVTDDVLFAGFKQAASIGADVVACVHCETGALIERARNELLARKPEGTLADWEDAHPAVAEALAIRTAAYLAKLAAVHLYVVHISSREASTPCAPSGAKAAASPPRPSRPSSAFRAMMQSDSWPRWCRRCARPSIAPRCGRPFATAPSTRSAPTTPRGGALRNAPRRACTAPAPAILRSARIFRSCCITAAAMASRSNASWIWPPARPPGPTASFRAKARSRRAPTPISSSSISSSRKSFAPKTCAACRTFRRSRARGWPVATIKAGKLAARDGEIVGEPSGRYLPRAAP